MAIKTVNPATNELVASFDEMTAPEIEQAINKANNTFQDWHTSTYEAKAILLHKVAGLMRQKKDMLAKLITLEMGKLIKESEGEIDLSADIFDYYATNGAKFLADQPIETDTGEAFVRCSAIGVVLGVQPWNFPFYQVARFAAPNIMIGNAVLLKHASNVPQCGITIASLFKEAGAPDGLYTNLLIPGNKMEPLVADRRIKAVSLTGSEGAGGSLAAAAGKYLKKCVLELGGSDAFIVLEDADIDKSVEWAVVGRMNNTGQCCVAAKRFIVVESVADEFLEKFIAKLAALKIGDPMEEGTQLGPLSSEDALIHLLDQVKRSVAAGATILLGGKRVDRKGAFMEATVISGQQSGADTFYEEFFGPVASFYRVKDEAAAILLANDSPFGLGGSVFTSDVERGKKVADQIDTGMVFINHPTWTKENLPFGGTKGSGYGRELSELGIKEFVNKKLIRTSKLSDPF